MASSAHRRRAAAKAAIWVSALTPAAWLVWRATQGELGANPVEEVLHRNGWWGLVLLTTTLAITPVRRLTGWHSIVRYRRLVGLFAFFYLTLHFSTYLVLDQWLAWEYILEDIAERPFITVGFAAWLLLLTLALTSTRGWIRRLARGGSAFTGSSTWLPRSASCTSTGRSRPTRASHSSSGPSSACCCWRVCLPFSGCSHGCVPVRRIGLGATWRRGDAPGRSEGDWIHQRCRRNCHDSFMSGAR